MSKTNNEQQKAKSAQIDKPRRKWFRSNRGTYQVYYAKGRRELRQIASHGVRISTILFLISNRVIDVRHVLKFLTVNGPVEKRVRQADLSDEKSFLNVAPAGFALTSSHRTFALLRECLMADLAEATREAILTTLGWYIWKKKPVFAHAGGIIGSDSDVLNTVMEAACGTTQTQSLTDIDQACSDVPILGGNDSPIENIHVEVPRQFNKYRLQVPQSIAEAQDAMRAVLDLLTLGDPNVTYIAVSAVFFSALRDPRFALFLYGETGSLKTAFALLLLSFFVADPQESDCASFKSTANALAARFSTSGNVPVIVDDYIEMPGARQMSEEVKKADNLIRAIVNGNAKERSASDGSLRPSERPRGIAIITGEVLPSGLNSLKSRMVNIPVDKSSFDEAVSGPRPNRFDDFQMKAQNGVFTNAMGGFIAWAASNYNGYQEFFDQPEHVFSANEMQHHRLRDAANDVISGMVLMLLYAKDLSVISDKEYERHAAISNAT